MLVQGATWPVNSSGDPKKVPEFTAAEKKLLVCQFEPRGSGLCNRGAGCEFSHDIPLPKAASPAAKAEQAAGTVPKAKAESVKATGTANNVQNDKRHNGYGAIVRALSQAHVLMTSCPELGAPLASLTSLKNDLTLQSGWPLGTLGISEPTGAILAHGTTDKPKYNLDAVCHEASTTTLERPNTYEFEASPFEGHGAPEDAVPAELAEWQVTLKGDGQEIEYIFDTQAERTGVSSLLRRLGDLGIGYKDLNTAQSSLEDIFVSLVHQEKAA